MANVSELKATARDRAGTGRSLRRSGQVPGIVYGDDKAPMLVTLDRAEIRQRIYAGHFLTTVHDLDVDGVKQRVIPRDFQLDPVRDIPIHVDFMRLGEGATIRVSIPIHVLNAEQAPGVKRGGTVNIVTHALDVRCPADAIPNSIDVDLTGVDIGHSRHLSDVVLPEGVRVVGSRDLTLVTIVAASGYIEEQRAAAEAAVAAAAAAAAAAEAGTPPEGAPVAAPGAAPAAVAGGTTPAGGDKGEKK